jgi:probable F420-dependent oxidoreductase
VELVTVRLSTSLRSFAPTDPGGWDHLVDAARRFDAAGVDRVVVSDHVVFGDDLDAYGRPELGGVTGGKQPTGPDGHWLEPLTTLAFLAGVTDRVRLGTNILLAALRRPVVLAKTAATLDVLSGGRLDLGVGVGWQRAEYEAAGLHFEDRGRLLDVTLETCQALWRQQVATVSMPELELPPSHMMPKPVQAGGVPIWVSGTVHRRVVERIARYGSGWIPWGVDADDLPTSIPRMKRALEDAGRDPDRLEVVGTVVGVRDGDGTFDIDATMARVPELISAGVTDVRITFSRREMEPERLEEIVAAFRRAAGPVPD